ncbi:MAG: hypothetical protein ACOYOL_13020, partial [Chthoniobacterales bacterium]
HLSTRPAGMDESLGSPPNIESERSGTDVHPTPVPPINLDGVPVRVRQIAVLRGLGYSFREIGEHLGVSPQAISLMLSRHRHRSKALRGAVELRLLSHRAINALGRHGIRNRREARQGNVIELLKGGRNCGRKTLQEVESWMNHNESNGSTI